MGSIDHRKEDYGLPKYSFFTKTVTKTHRKGLDGITILSGKKDYSFRSLPPWGSPFKVILI